MKIEKIELNKIKVTLSAGDLMDMNINIKSLTPSSPSLHGFLFEVMKRVQRETGFNPYSGQVVVEATPCDGGIVLTVTRIKEEPQQKRSRRVRAVGKRSPRLNTYRFEGFEDLCRLFESADACEFENAGLYEYNGSFFLAIPKENRLPLAEFAETGHSAALGESFLAEHGKLHAKGESLVTMAEGVKKLNQ